ncbi:MAG: CAP domain-containing protein [Monoraphidium minutum]|nr:MAG: CAP domain-containing protein [Monoraphidium minutum]
MNALFTLLLLSSSLSCAVASRVLRLGGADTDVAPARPARVLQESPVWSGFQGPSAVAASSASATGQQAVAFAAAAAQSGAAQQPMVMQQQQPQQQQQQQQPFDAYQQPTQQMQMPAYYQQPMQQGAMQQGAMQQQPMQQGAMQQQPMQQQQQQQQQPMQQQSAGQMQMPSFVQQAPQQQAYGVAPSGASPSGGFDMGAALSMHNTLRAQHGAAALTLSPQLQASAQAWADRCVFQHSGGGENLAQFFPNPLDGIQAWIDEGRMYTPGSDYSSATGHYTQMIWKATSQVGCGWAPSCQLFVCHYDPPGNVLGQFAQNVS